MRPCTLNALLLPAVLLGTLTLSACGSSAPSAAPDVMLPDLSESMAEPFGRLAYFTGDGSQDRLEVLDFEQQAEVFSQVVALTASTSFRLASDGSRLAYANSVDQADGSEVTHSCTVVDLDGSGSSRNCLPDQALFPRIIGVSADGSQVGLLWTRDNGELRFRVGVWSADTGVTDFGAIAAGRFPGFAVLSPDGTQIYVEQVDTENRQVALLGFDAQGATGLRVDYPAEVVASNRGFTRTHMYLSADGQRIMSSVRVQDGNGETEAGLSLDLASGSLTLYRAPLQLWSMAPNGQLLTGLNSSNGERVFLEFGSTSPIISLDEDFYYVGWSPDSAQIAYRISAADIYRSTVPELPNGSFVRSSRDSLFLPGLEWSNTP